MLVIWLIYHQIVIICENGMCNQVSMAHFNYLVSLGTLEVILEIWSVIKIFTKRKPNQNKTNMIITKKSHRKF